MTENHLYPCATSMFMDVHICLRKQGETLAPTWRHPAVCFTERALAIILCKPGTGREREKIEERHIDHEPQCLHVFIQIQRRKELCTSLVLLLNHYYVMLCLFFLTCQTVHTTATVAARDLMFCCSFFILIHFSTEVILYTGNNMIIMTNLSQRNTRKCITGTVSQFRFTWSKLSCNVWPVAVWIRVFKAALEFCCFWCYATARYFSRGYSSSSFIRSEDW